MTELLTGIEIDWKIRERGRGEDEELQILISRKNISRKEWKRTLGKR